MNEEELRIEEERLRYKKEELDRREINLLDRDKALILREQRLRQMFNNIEKDILKHIREIRDTPMLFTHLNATVSLPVCSKDHIGFVPLVDGKCPVCDGDKNVRP